MNKFLKFLKIATLAVAMMFILLPISGIVANAQAANLEACNSEIYNKKITFTSLFNIGNFLPLIPASCGVGADDGVNALPLIFLFDIIIRTAGFIFSFAFYMLPTAIVIYGARVLFLPFDPGLNYNEFLEVRTAGRTITKTLGQFLTGIVIILFSYTLVFTILQVLQINTTGTEDIPITTDLRSFFTL
jgi:hypothetical protein